MNQTFNIDNAYSVPLV